MPFDFLNTTTYDNDLSQQNDMMNYIMSQAQNDQDKEAYDPDLVEIASQAEPNAPEEQESTQQDDSDDDDTPGSSFEPPDDTDDQLMSYLLGQSMGDEDGLRNAKNFVSLPDDMPGSLNWMRQRGNQQNSSSSSKYSNSLPNLHIQNNKYGGIHIKEENKGKFSAAASRAGMGVQEYAAHVLSNPNASSTARKRANFARNASKWNHQFGGSTLYADDETTLRRGLNDPNYNSALLKLKGTNEIRGLDNGQPVAVTDGSKYKILTNKYDTANFSGPVYEHRL